MNLNTSYPILFLFSIFDAVICITITLASCEWSLFTLQKELSSFTFSTSTLELLILPFIRFSIYTGGLIAVIYNPKESLRRCKSLKKFVAVFCLAQFYYVVIKLLIISDGSYFIIHLKDPLFWAILGWNALASLIFYYQWSLLTQSKVSNYVLVSEYENIESINTCNQGYQSVNEDNSSSNGVSFKFNYINSSVLVIQQSKL